MSYIIAGTFTGGIVLFNPTLQNPATLVTGGYITNTTTLHNGNAVYGTNAAAWNFTNLGTIKGVGASSAGVYLRGGGTVTNAATASISGVLGGVAIFGTTGSVANTGAIRGNGLTGIGIYLGRGGTIVNGATNATSAQVSGGKDGVSIFGTAASTLSNYGTIQGTAASSFGIYLVPGATIRNSASGVISGLLAGISLVGSSTSAITNFGSIGAAGSAGAGIALKAGATVTNAVNAWISGVRHGIYIGGGGDSVSNSGTILGTGTGTAGHGVYMIGGGSVSNASSGVILGGNAGVVMLGTAVNTVNNLGVVASSGSAGLYGIYMRGAGTVINGATDAASAVIYGAAIGLNMQLPSGIGTANNFGTILGSSGPLGIGVRLGSNGIVVNGATNSTAALISGGNIGVAIRGTTGTVGNFGTIAGVGTYKFADGIYMNAGTVVNGAPNVASALISGISYGVVMLGTGVSTVSNFGTISGGGIGNFGVPANPRGIFIGGQGRVVNGATNATTALISGSIVGIDIAGTAASTVSNFGTITTTASASSATSVFPTGAALIGPGTVINGATNAISALIHGASIGIVLGTPASSGTATVSNLGTITGGSATAGIGVDLADNGSVINGAPNSTAALISAGFVGVAINGTAGTVINFGTIASIGTFGAGVDINTGAVTNNGVIEAGPGGFGISLHGGIAVNTGMIEAAQNGYGVSVYGNNNGTVLNQGTIVAEGPAGTAVAARGGVFINQGLVIGHVSGIVVSPGTTGAGKGSVTLAGTVVGATGISVSGTAGQTLTVGGTVIGTSGTAVSLTKAGSDRLILQPGAVFQGSVDGGGGSSVLEVAASPGGVGAATGEGVVPVDLGSVRNFSELEVDASAATHAGGTLIFDTLVNQGEIDLVSGDSLAVGTVASAANGGTIDLRTGGTIHFTGPVADNQTVLFHPPGGTVVIDHPEQFAAAITEFAAADIIDLPLGQASFQQYSGGLLSLSYGGGSVALRLSTLYATPQFLFTGDGAGGTDILVSDAACFCRGTMILTDRGEAPVEALAVGDRVMTLSGALKPIEWIGMGRDLVTRANKLARPVIVRAGALADGVPYRDLYLTHGHALFLDGVLIPVENLINHRSILWDESARVVEYYHVELEDHDVVLADGAPAETYYDASNRALFQTTRPGSAPAAAKPTFAPVLNGGAAVEAVWSRLFERARGRRPTDTTDDPDLHLVVDGRRLDPTATEGHTYSFAIASPPVSALSLHSRSAVPSLLGITAHDHRRLGVAIRRIVISQPGVATAIEHDAPLFIAGGCHPAEPGYCWTDGQLTLSPHLFAHLTGSFTLAIHTERPGMRYPSPPAVAGAA